MNVMFYLLTILALNSASMAELRTWDGEAGDNQWTTPTNWDNDQVPEFDADVIIPLDDTVYIVSALAFLFSLYARQRRQAALARERQKELEAKVRERMGSLLTTAFP